MKAATSGIGILGLFLDLFQSTPPVKAATQIFSVVTPVMPISIHAAREGGDYNVGYCLTKRIISIHAAREGGDYQIKGTENPKPISIHAAREGGDSSHLVCLLHSHDFNPRRP